MHGKFFEPFRTTNPYFVLVVVSRYHLAISIECTSVMFIQDVEHSHDLQSSMRMSAL